MNKVSWKVKPFEKCIKKIIYTNKIKRENYLSNGKYPIISQDDSLISGYWEKEQDVFYVDTPLVIFGDHTRILKYIDFNFVLGADGVKILLPNDDLIAKFFYYYLVWYNIPNLGYSRHYKLLKEIEVLIPPISIQKQIVKELDTLSDIITKKKEQLAELDKLAQATFYDMFGDPIKNEKNWCIKKIGAFSSVGTGATPNRQKEDIYFGGKIPWVKTTEVCGLEIKKTEECITEQALKDTNCKLFPINTILLAMYGQGKTRGQVGLLKIEATTNQACAAIFPEKEVNNKFLYLYLKLNYQYIRSLGRGGNQENLNLSLVKSIPVIIPPIFLQNQFAEKIEAIEHQKELINQSITNVQLLFDYTMDKYFN